MGWGEFRLLPKPGSGLKFIDVVETLQRKWFAQVKSPS
jgi:hypothetical protein